MKKAFDLFLRKLGFYSTVVSLISIFSLIFLINPQPASAFACPADLGFSLSPNPAGFDDQIRFRFSVGLQSSDYLEVQVGNATQSVYCVDDPGFCENNSVNVFTFDAQEVGGGNHTATVRHIDGLSNTTECTLNLTINETPEDFCDDLGLSSVTPSGDNYRYAGCIGPNDPLVSSILITYPNNNTREVYLTSAADDGSISGNFSSDLLGGPGVYTAQMYVDRSAVGPALTFGTEDFGEEEIPEVPPARRADQNDEVPPYKFCDQIPDPQKRGQCCSCATGSPSCDGNPESSGGVWTAVGCISINPSDMIGTLIGIALNIAGGVALLTILAAAFKLSTSQGEPKKVQDAREMLTSAIIGLLFIVFSVTILEFIGYDILAIPGFGGV